MKLIANTVLSFNDRPVNYEILLFKDMLLFKPFFYNLEPQFPCIVLIQFETGWQLQQTVDKKMEKQIKEDLTLLKTNKAA